MTDKPTPTDLELTTLLCAHWPAETNDWASHMDFARAVLEKWGQPAQATKCECTLAQRCTGSGCRYCNPQEYIDMLHDQIADSEIAQATEPVAYLYCGGQFGCELDDWEIQADQQRCDKLNEHYGALGKESRIPLFLAPQPVAREPLTPEQIATAGEIEDNDSAFLAGFSTGARFAEQYHGIKGGQHVGNVD